MRRPKVSRTTKILILFAAIAGLGAGGYFAWHFVWWHLTHYVVERTDYNRPRDELKFVDDRLDDKNPAFDETLVDSRLLGDWQVNKSAAVIKLDCPAIKPDREAPLLVLRPSYADAWNAAKAEGHDVLPSANLPDGAAKQFDDGLYAAVELACFRGELGLSAAVPDFLEAVFAELSETSPARPFLAAALELGGRRVELAPDEAREKDSLLGAFQRDNVGSKPIAFYNWTPELQQVWRCLRFLQREFESRELAVPRAAAGVLENNAELLAQYRAINGLYAQLTNPAICLPVDALAGTDESLAQLAERHGVRRQTVSIIPPATSPETELFDRLFDTRLPAEANLMATLIHRIRSGEVDLAPDEQSGWYQYQAHALETMLLPSKGQEDEKLLLTASYKKRLVEAFKALITKRRETHVRHFGPLAAAPLQPGEVRPRLRVEPCITFYLRSARAYDFLQNFLLATVGRERLAKLHGLREGGLREPNLADELGALRDRFYGFYLISCEDVGMRPVFLEDESVDQQAAQAAALAWLESLPGDPDLACDTRAAVPIFRSLRPDKTRVWATLGVRLARLDASYARPPQVRPLDEQAEDREWRDPERRQLGTSHFVIPVDEFAEFELDGSNVLTRSELRAACSQYKTKEAILEALSAE